MSTLFWVFQGRRIVISTCGKINPLYLLYRNRSKKKGRKKFNGPSCSSFDEDLFTWSGQWSRSKPIEKSRTWRQLLDRDNWQLWIESSILALSGSVGLTHLLLLLPIGSIFAQLLRKKKSPKSFCLKNSTNFGALTLKGFGESRSIWEAKFEFLKPFSKFGIFVLM